MLLKSIVRVAAAAIVAAFLGLPSLALAYPEECWPSGSTGAFDGSRGDSQRKTCWPIGAGPTLTHEYNPDSAPPSLVNLATSACINGICVEPTVLCYGANATPTAWTCVGAAMTVTGSGTAPAGGVDTALMGPLDSAVRIADGGKFYASSTTAPIGTDDLLIRYVARNTAQGILAGIYQAGARWTLYFDAVSGRQDFELHNGVTQRVVSTANGSMVAGSGALQSYMVAVDRSEASTNGSRAFVNGAASGAGVDFSALVASDISNAVTLKVGGDALDVWGGDILFFAIHRHPGWFAGGATNIAQWTAAAMEETARLSGAWPRIARGDAPPTTMTRTSVATLSKCTAGVTTLFTVGHNWARVNRDCAGRLFYWPESGITNILLQTEDISTSWNNSALGVAVNVTAAPNATLTADRLTADSGVNNFHSRYQNATFDANGIYTCSAFVKADTASWPWMGMDVNGQQRATFNASTCTPGTNVNGTATLKAESLGGWCRISMRATVNGTGGSMPFSLGIAQDANTLSYVGAGEALYAWGAQCEKSALATSYYATTTAPAARASDALRFAGAGNASSTQGTFICDILLPGYDNPSFLHVAQLNNGSLDTESVTLAADSTDVGRLQVRANTTTIQADILGTTDITAGVPVTIGGSWKANEFKLHINGAQQGATDTSGLVPAPFTSIWIGVLGGPNGGIRRCRVLDRPVVAL